MPASATVASKPAPAAKTATGKAPKAAAGPSPVPRSPARLPAFARNGESRQQAPLKPLLPRAANPKPGAPMAPFVRQAIENSLGVDLGTVRVHADADAQNKARSLSARAFSFGSDIFLGEGENASDVALMAHESAHVVQQQSGAAVQAWSPDRSGAFEQEADRAAQAVTRGEDFAVAERVDKPRVQRLGIKDALDYFADAAYNIPGYRMFTIIIGVNPINMEHVDGTPANILRAAVEFMPGGKLISQALDAYGVLEKAGAWVKEQLDALAITGASINKAIHDFLDSLSWRDIFHLGDVWDRAKRIFSEPIDQIKNLLLTLLEGIWKFIREAILKPLAKLAEGTAGWDLLIAVLGRNPITGEAVPRTPDTLIGGFMKLIHEEEIWENIKKGNAISRAWAWFQQALAGTLAFVSRIPTLFVEAVKSLTWTDIIDLPAGFMKVAGVFGKFVVNFISWAGSTVWDLLQIIFDVVAPAVMPYLKKLGAAFRTVLRNPIGFVKNLVAAGKLGFELFVSNIGAHLKASFIEWLTGSLPGVYIPKALELHEIVKFVLSVLGLTWQNIRGKLVKIMGETTVAAMEKGFDIVVKLVREGPAAAWEQIREELSNLKDMVMQAIMNFIIETVVKKAVAKVVGLLVPGGAFIQAILSIYDTVMVFVQKLAKIAQVVKAFLDSMMEIASGAIAAAGAKVESTLAGLLTLAINFLAGFLGLGKIADKVMEIINTKIRAPIDKALDRVINWIVQMAGKLWKGVKGAAQSVFDWWKQKQPFQADDGSSHTLLFVGEGENAELAFQSTTTKVESFLEGLPTPTKDQKDLVTVIKNEIKVINAVRTVNQPTDAKKLTDQEIQDNKDKVAKSLLKISEALGKLAGGGRSWGTKDKPLPMNYPKPPAAAYMKLYFGPRTEVDLPQDVLRAAYPGGAKKAATIIGMIQKKDKEALKAWAARDYTIEMYQPAAGGQLPEGGAQIGIAPDYQTKVGMKLNLIPGNTAGGSKITRALNHYGYSNEIEHTDGDHIVEMQLGGPNELENLWPLDSAVNQNSGRTIASMEIAKPDGKTTIKMPDLKDEARKRGPGDKGVWLVIAQTEG